MHLRPGPLRQDLGCRGVDTTRDATRYRPIYLCGADTGTSVQSIEHPGADDEPCASTLAATFLAASLTQHVHQRFRLVKIF